MRTRTVVVLTTAALTAALAAAPGAEAAGPAVAVTRVQYDSPGPDDRSTASLNAEWVRLTNTTRGTVDLRGWTVRDATGHTYRFATTYRLGAGRHVWLHTGPGTDGRPDAGHRYWQSRAYVWNNTGDTATLRDAAGRTVDTCAWRGGGTYTAC